MASSNNIQKDQPMSRALYDYYYYWQIHIIFAYYFYGALLHDSLFQIHLANINQKIVWTDLSTTNL